MGRCPYCQASTPSRPLWTEPACPSDADRLPPALATRRVTVAQCGTCAGVFVERDFPESLLATFYALPPRIPVTDEHAYWWDRTTQAANAHLLSRLGPARGRLLEVGCGRGLLSRDAAARGWDVTALDCNPAFTRFIDAAYGLRTVTGDISNADRGYDAVVLADVLEHLYDPISTLRACAERLVPGGRIAIKVPHGAMQIWKERVRRWLGRSPGYVATIGHLNQFTPAALTRVLTTAGFTAVRVEPGPLFLPQHQPMRRIVALGNAVMLKGPTRTSLHLLALAQRH